MRILFINWVDYLDAEQRGGGVSVYQANLIRALAPCDEISADFLSAGLEYDLLANTPRWRRVGDGPRPGTARFEIVNSGCLAPSHASFGSATQICHDPTERAFERFLRTSGPYDVVHFNNLEGLPAGVLALRRRFPGTRFILSLHNYYPFCPQVNFWVNEAANCRDFRQGNRCVECLPSASSPALMRYSYALAGQLKRVGLRPGTRGFDAAFRPMGWAGRKIAGLARREAPKGDGAAHFAGRRAAFVRLINQNCDRVLCVSDRVRQIATAHGIDPALMATDYIGSPHAARFAQPPRRRSVLRPDGTLQLGYLGYMRRDKGFPWLLDAVEALPPRLAARLRLLVAARAGPDPVMARLAALRTRLAGLVHVDGYQHSELDGILADVDVGVVPVLWEDNLPQVALEMHARRIPLLTSDFGGAQELGRCPDMVFHAGDPARFAERLQFLLDERLEVDRYWRGAQAPQSMQAHVAALLDLYRGARAQEFRATG